MSNMKNLIGALCLLLTACAHTPIDYEAEDWATIPLEQARAECRSETDQMMDKLEIAMPQSRRVTLWDDAFRMCMAAKGYRQVPPDVQQPKQ